MLTNPRNKSVTQHRYYLLCANIKQISGGNVLKAFCRVFGIKTWLVSVRSSLNHSYFILFTNLTTHLELTTTRSYCEPVTTTV